MAVVNGMPGYRVRASAMPGDGCLCLAERRTNERSQKKTKAERHSESRCHAAGEAKTEDRFAHHGAYV